MNKLKVNMNYKTGRKGENNCRIVSAGSELDKMYEKAYLEWTENERKKKIMEQEPQRDGAGEWILS